MACWPATIVGAFFIVLILFDIYISNYNDLPMHGVTGVLLTLVFWVICSTLGQGISAGILVVPATFAIVFILGIWFAKKSLQNRGCCVSCAGAETNCVCPPEKKEIPIKCEPEPKCKPDVTSKQGIINLNAGFFE